MAPIVSENDFSKGSILIAFANLFGSGGAPLFSIARGKGDHQRAEQIMGNAFMMLMISGVLLTIIGLLVKRPVLYLFGASGAIPIISFNYGARKLCRVRTGIKFMTVACIAYTVISWIVLMIIPEIFIRIFTTDAEVISNFIGGYASFITMLVTVWFGKLKKTE